MSILSKIKRKKSKGGSKKQKKKKYAKVKVTLYEVKYHTGKRTLTRRFEDMQDARRFAKEAIMKGYDVQSVRKRTIERELEGVTRKDLLAQGVSKMLQRIGENAADYADYYTGQYSSSPRKSSRKKRKSRRSKKRSTKSTKRHKKPSNKQENPFTSNIFSW